MTTILKIASALAVLLLASCSRAEGPTFESEAGEGFLTVYSTSDKPYHCEIMVKFTFVDPAGVRKPGERICFAVDRPAGERINVCDAKHPMFVQPVVESVEARNCVEPGKK